MNGSASLNFALETVLDQYREIGSRRTIEAIAHSDAIATLPTSISEKPAKSYFVEVRSLPLPSLGVPWDCCGAWVGRFRRMHGSFATACATH
jgi:hypothetical protein